MTYTVTVTSSTTSLQFTCTHIVPALDLVRTISRNSVNTIELLTDVAQMGEWLDCIGEVWFRVVAGPLH
jgi:hypothetical protein